MNPALPIVNSQLFLGVQTGYIVVPSDVDREVFVAQCYRTERVSLLVERGGGVIHECYITREALSRVTFPDAYTQLGSCVIFLTDVHSGHPLIFGALSKEDETQLLSEGQFEISKYFLGNSVIISGDAARGVINITIDGGTLTQLNITVGNAERTALINIRCRGGINVQADGDVNISSEGIVKLNNGAEPMVKGNELQTQLEATNDYISRLKSAVDAALAIINAVVPGCQAAFDNPLISQQPGDYNDINSEQAFLD